MKKGKKALEDMEDMNMNEGFEKLNKLKELKGEDWLLREVMCYFDSDKLEEVADYICDMYDITLD